MSELMSELIHQSNSETEVDEPNKTSIRRKRLRSERSLKYTLPPKPKYTRRFVNKYVDGKYVKVERYVLNLGNTLTKYKSYYNMIVDIMKDMSELEKIHTIEYIKSKTSTNSDDLKILIDSMPYRICQQVAYYIKRKQNKRLPLLE